MYASTNIYYYYYYYYCNWVLKVENKLYIASGSAPPTPQNEKFWAQACPVIIRSTHRNKFSHKIYVLLRGKETTSSPKPPDRLKAHTSLYSIGIVVLYWE